MFYNRSLAKDDAARRAGDIELEPEMLGASIDFLDGYKLKSVVVDDYAFVQAACVRGIQAVHWVLANYNERPLTRTYAFIALAQVQVDGNANPLHAQLRKHQEFWQLMFITAIDSEQRWNAYRSYSGVCHRSVKLFERRRHVRQYEGKNRQASP